MQNQNENENVLAREVVLFHTFNGTIVNPQDKKEYPIFHPGLTVEDYVATMAMQSFISLGQMPADAAYAAWQSALEFMKYRKEYYTGVLESDDDVFSTDDAPNENSDTDDNGTDA